MLSAATNSHRAFMAVTMTLAVVLTFGLWVGWQAHAEKQALRRQLDELEARKRVANKLESLSAARSTQPGGAGSGGTSLGDAVPSGMAGGEKPFVEEPFIQVLPLKTGSVECLKAEQVVADYLAAGSWEMRVPYVWDPKVTEAKMEKFYVDQKGSDPELGELMERNHLMMGAIEVFHLGYQVKGSVRNAEVALRRDAGGEWKIDWESLVGFCEISWEVLREAPPGNPVLMRGYLVPEEEADVVDGFRLDAAFSVQSVPGEHEVKAVCSGAKPMTAYLLGRHAEAKKALPYAFRVKASSQSRAASVEIVEIISSRWLLLRD